MIESLNYVKTKSLNVLYFIIGKINGYMEEKNTNKFLPLVHSNENKDKLNKYKDLQNEVRDLIR